MCSELTILSCTKQYSNEVDFTSMGEAQMGGKGEPVPNWR